MAAITGLTAARMLSIEGASVVSGTINAAGHLILTKKDGTTIDAGSALPALPDASTTQKGIVELATGAETDAGTDSTRAATPASLVKKLVTYIDGTLFGDTTPTANYPNGVSLLYIDNTTATAKWPTFAGKWGILSTVNWNGGDTYQTWTRLSSGGATPELWTRAGNNANGWTSWQRVILNADLVVTNNNVTANTNALLDEQVMNYMGAW